MGCGRYFIVEAGGGILLVNPFTIIHTTNRSSSPGLRLCGGLTGFEWSSGALATVFTSWSLSARLCPLITVEVS